jgi:hypothetical protein
MAEDGVIGTRGAPPILGLATMHPSESLCSP